MHDRAGVIEGLFYFAMYASIFIYVFGQWGFPAACAAFSTVYLLMPYRR